MTAAPAAVLAAAGTDGLPAALAVVAIGGVVAMLLRVLRAEAARRAPSGSAPSGYPVDARREHPPVTERP